MYLAGPGDLPRPFLLPLFTQPRGISLSANFACAEFAEVCLSASRILQ